MPIIFQLECAQKLPKRNTSSSQTGQNLKTVVKSVNSEQLHVAGVRGAIHFYHGSREILEIRNSPASDYSNDYLKEVPDLIKAQIGEEGGKCASGRALLDIHHPDPKKYLTFEVNKFYAQEVF